MAERYGVKTRRSGLSGRRQSRSGDFMTRAHDEHRRSQIIGPVKVRYQQKNTKVTKSQKPKTMKPRHTPVTLTRDPRFMTLALPRKVLSHCSIPAQPTTQHHCIAHASTLSFVCLGSLIRRRRCCRRRLPPPPPLHVFLVLVLVLVLLLLARVSWSKRTFCCGQTPSE